MGLSKARAIPIDGPRYSSYVINKGDGETTTVQINTLQRRLLYLPEKSS